jgi:hypothetical protein
MWKMTSMAYFYGIYPRMALQLKQKATPHIAQTDG